MWNWIKKFFRREEPEVETTSYFIYIPDVSDKVFEVTEYFGGGVFNLREEAEIDGVTVGFNWRTELHDKEFMYLGRV